MALTQTDLDNLKTAMANGHLTVEFGGRRVTYRSVAELERQIAFVEVELAKASATPPARVSYAAHRRD